MLQTICETLEAQKPRVDKLAEDTKALERHASSEIKNTYMQEFKEVQGRWDKLKLKTSKDVKLLEEIMPKLRIFEVKSKVFFYFWVAYLSCFRDLSLCSCRSPDETD